MTIRNKLIATLRRNLQQAILTRELDQAADLLRRLKVEDPLSVECRGLELEYLLVTHRREDARQLADQLVHFHPGSARIQYLAGRVDYQAKNYSRALAFFSESNHLHPHWRARLWCGKSLTQLGRYAEAEALLLELYASHSQTARDLAWLYERMENTERALHYLERYLQKHPDDALARAQQQRLRSRILPPEELLEEVEMLAGLGEAIPPQMQAVYLQRLLEKGEGAAARRFVDEQRVDMEPAQAASLAWICYRLHAYDLALKLFVAGLPVQFGNYKYLQALEATAARCNRLADLIASYEQYAPEQKKLYGRIRRLRKRIEK